MNQGVENQLTEAKDTRQLIASSIILITLMFFHV